MKGAEELLGEVGDSQGYQDAHHPGELVHLGVHVCHVQAQIGQVGFSGERSVQRLRYGLALCVGQRRSQFARGARSFQALHEFIRIERDGSDAHIVV